MQGRPNAIIDKKSKRILVQTPLPRFNCLALEGGGVACTGHAGAINILEKYGLLEEVDYVSGVSGGAIAALAICLGYTSEEITKILANLPMDTFMEDSQSWSFTPSFFSSLRKFISVWRSPDFSLSSGKVMYAWVQKLVKDKMGDENFTLAQHARKLEEEKTTNNGKTRLKKLYVGGTDLSLQIPEVKILCAETYPDMPMAMATVISALYPFLFSPIEYQGHRWGDGGIKTILLTKVFDDKKFLPDGYTFTEKGVNPGVLAVKVDTYDEIMQIIWGVNKEVKLNKTSQYAWAVANATMHNTDVDEIREARTTIPLTDADVDRLDLNLDPKVKLRLVEEAEETTKEFFENYIDSAYQVTSYANIKEWLATLTIENLSSIRDTYKSMREELLAMPQENAAREAQTEYDPAKPTVADLTNQIKFLKAFIAFKLKKNRKNDPELIYPDRHINISPEFSKNGWHAALKKEMHERLEILNAKIESADGEYKKLITDLAGCMQALAHVEQDKAEVEPFHGHHDEKVQVLASYAEHLTKLRAERDGIECKLGLKSENHVKANLENSKEYATLYEKFGSLNKATDLSATLRSIIISSLPVFTFVAGSEQPVEFSMDMRNSRDRKLYLIAAMLYLEKRACYDRARFRDIYDIFFPDETTLPGSVHDLMRIIGEADPTLRVSMFRLENLLHYFEKCEYPTYKPAMDLDVMFGLAKNSFFAKPAPKKDNEIEMQLVFKTSDKTRHSGFIPLIIGSEDDSDNSAEDRPQGSVNLG